ncbi:hypothetical protein L4X63_11865 [Geomonas sp. Red32]|uniref:hypothetical protein n=1 Tax=Geomonas sp. Red32 TaxID=2912856 RepID=UPI00202CC762|nr:hypothetical protein [Geomonas sp. Red32]MCM0082286.1 hypothetical protein [Geomonas sp. Red32]
MTLRLTGDDVATVTKKWVLKELESAPAVAHDLGKYFFATSTATLGALATLAKLTPPVPGGLRMGILLLFISAGFGIALSIPLPKRVDDDLFELYRVTVRRILVFSVIWLLFWLAGTIWALLFIL